MRLSTIRASWVGAAALTVLGTAAVSAVVLASAPLVPVPVPAAAAPGTPVHVLAAYELPPAPLVLSFPSDDAPAAAGTQAPAPVRTAAARTTRTSRRTSRAAVRIAPVPAPVAADPRCSGDGWEQRRGEAALASLRRPSDAAQIAVSFQAGRPDILGLAHLQEHSVEVFVRSCEREPEALLRHVVAHEIGHVVDATRMTLELREQWLAARGIPAGTAWFGCDRCTDFATPAGDFAETYSQWQRDGSDSRSQLAAPAPPAELERLAAQFF